MAQRGIRIALLIAALAVLIWYGKVYNPTITLGMCLSDPVRYDGQLADIGLEVTVVETWADSFRVRQMGTIVTIAGLPGEAKPGDFVRLLARFRAPGRLELVQLYAAKGRRSKIAWSIAPLLVLAMLWLRRYHFSFSGFYWQERKKCQTW